MPGERDLKKRRLTVYDILFFEALGEEYDHLIEEIERAKKAGTLPAGLKYLVTPETLQAFLESNPETELPDILSIKTHSVLPEAWYANGPKKSVISRSAGYDHIEHLSGVINATSLRRYCVNAVAETAVKFVFAACGNLNQYQANMATFERNRCISFKELSNLKVTVFGVGKIGSRIYEILKGIGMDAYAVDIRSEELSKEYGPGVRFIEKEESYDSDIIVCGMNYTKEPSSRFYNKNYFSDEFFSKCKPGLVFVNVTRGEITDECALLKRLKDGSIFGLGLDAFAEEEEITNVLKKGMEPKTALAAAQKELVRLSVSREGNVYTQPHQAFNSDVAALDKAVETVKHLEAYYRNAGRCFDSQLPYYD